MIQPIKKGPKALEYPSESSGSRLAAQVRAKANPLSEKQRETHMRKAMELIYGGNRKKQAARTGH
jgi:hypothetical protein